ncbi:MAG: haloacid dehalogenase type II [Dehalococcoidia bacterium]
MTVDLGKIRALTFDVGGTVFDWHHGIRDEVARLAAARGVNVDAAKFANEWRREMFVQLGQVRGGTLPWMNADELHRRALDVVAPNHAALALSEDDKDALNTIWHRLGAWPDFPATLPRLRQRYTTTVLTVLSFAIVVDSSKHNGLSWDAITSCEVFDHYKPDKEAYLRGVKLLGVKPEEAMMVACHAGDLRAAAAAGLHTAYVPRPTESGDGPAGDIFAPANRADGTPEFDVVAADFPDLATRLGV